MLREGLSAKVFPRLGLRENDHACRIAVQKIAPTNRTDFALGKKPCGWNWAEALLHDPAIMVGLAEESLTAPATTEQKGPEGRTLVFRAIRSQEKV